MLELDFELQRGDVSLQIKHLVSQPITGIMGPSGCGKSTLLAVIAGLLQPRHGNIVLNQQVLLDTGNKIQIPAHRRRIGLVFQDGQLLPHLTVYRNLLYGYNNIAKPQRSFAPAAVIELLEIGHLLERHPRALSGGEQQRVALGRAILYAPKLLLLDEPLSALDDRLKQQILLFLLEIKKQFGIPMLYVSHSMSEIQFIADECLVMENGRLTAMPSQHPETGQDALIAR